ncbi:MAG: GxxExxY protein [Anaerolineales bacterium]
MEKDKVLHREISYRVMGAVFEVHNALGPGFAERIYEEALAQELMVRAIPFTRQQEVAVRYKGHVVGTHRLDLLIDEKIVLELKAVSALNDALKQQTLSYLKAAGLKLGILINFGTPRVEYVRITN